MLTEIFNAEVTQTPAHITLTQKRFIESLAEKEGIDTKNSVHTPANMDLLDLVWAAADDKSGVVDSALRDDYRAIVGALLYVSVTTLTW